MKFFITKVVWSLKYHLIFGQTNNINFSSDANLKWKVTVAYSNEVRTVL